MYEYEYGTNFTLIFAISNIYKSKIDGYPMFN